MLIGRIIHRTLLVINIMAALGLLLTYASVFVNPEKFWLAALYGLLYPFLLIINLIFLFYWTFRWKRMVFISVVAILLGVNHFNAFIQFPFGRDTSKKSNGLRIVSYNVNLFRLYPWAKSAPSHQSIFSYIKQGDFDIVCLQEYYVKAGKLSNEVAEKLAGMPVYTSFILRRSSSAYGLAILTKLPVLRTGEISFPNSFNSCMYADVVKGTDTIRVYNLHLQSTRLKERNFNFLMGNEFKLDSKNYDELKDLASRLGQAFIKRARQVNLVIEHMRSCPYPILICGDFNDSPVSYTYHKLTRKLFDTYKDAGTGIVLTYNGIWPSYRIDYVLRSSHFKTIGYRSPRFSFSDHYPVEVELELTQN